VVQDNDRHLDHLQLAGSQQAGVPSDDHAVRADENRIRPAKLHDAGCDLGDLLVRVCPAVPCIREGVASRVLRAIVNEKPIAWPDEVLRMRPAYFRIFASKIHGARILQIVVETVLR
jgi:hypothetical protein